ncbi:MAG: ribbon-helix-helix domain-containing protein [bacterium]
MPKQLTLIRTNVTISKTLLSSIDKLAGKRGRSRFIAEAAAQQVKKATLLQTMGNAAGSWTVNDHPELKAGASVYVAKQRKENDKRTPKP